MRIVVVSNWDWSLHERLPRPVSRALVDGALASAEVGAAKPEGAIFAAALRARRARPARTPGMSATRPRPTSRAPAPPVCARS